MPLRTIYHKYATGGKAALNTSLPRVTTLDINIGPPIKVFHRRTLTIEQRNSLKSAVEEARLNAIDGHAGLASGGDGNIEELRDEFKNSFRFDIKEGATLSKRVIRTAELIRNGVMSKNLSIKFYHKDSSRLPDGVDGRAREGLSEEKDPRVTISLSEKVFDVGRADRASATINHEVAHNVASLADFGERGYAQPDFTEVAAKMVPTLSIPSQVRGGQIQPHEAVRNADSYAAYLKNRAAILSAMERIDRVPDSGGKQLTIEGDDFRSELIRRPHTPSISR